MAKFNVSNLMFTNGKTFELITPPHIKVENIQRVPTQDAWAFTYTVKTVRRLVVSGITIVSNKPEDVVRQINADMMAEANRIRHLVERTPVEPEPEDIEIEVSL